MKFYSREQIAQHDLEWYYFHSDADCNIKSNYMSMVNVAVYGSSTNYQDPYNTFILNSVHYRREIEHILRDIPAKDRKILQASFGMDTYHPYVEKIFKKHAGAAYINSITSSYDSFEHLCERISKNKATPEDKLMISRIRIESSNNYQRAINTYYQCKQDTNET